MGSNVKAKRDEIMAGVVAGGAFAASAAHIVTVAVEAGNHFLIAAVHAIGIDGLIYIGIRAMQRGQKITGGLALFYGVAVSLTFNAASYGAFAMPKIVIAFTMPVALLLAVLVVHGAGDHGDEGQDTATASALEVDVHLRRQSVPASRPSERPIRATVSHPERPTVPADVVLDAETVSVQRPAPRPAIGGGPARPASIARAWDAGQLEAARALIAAGGKSDMAMAREVFGPEAAEAEKKKIERLRRREAGTN